MVADSRSPRDGKFIEEIGTYQPLKKDGNFVLDLERAKYWVSKGAYSRAIPVASFIKKAGRAAAAVAGLNLRFCGAMQAFLEYVVPKGW